MTTDSGVISGLANQTQDDVKQSDKELNFARLRQERDLYAQANAQLSHDFNQMKQEIESLKKGQKTVQEVDDDDDAAEPYIDSRTLKKTLSKWEQRIEQKIDRKAEEKARAAVEQERRDNFIYRLKAEYGDFDQVLTKDTANKLEEAHPELAKQILQIGDDYQKRKTAYETIKALGLHKKPDPENTQTIQDRVNQNLRNQAYSPASAGNNPMPTAGDFSENGKKAAYEKIQALKSKLGYR